MDATEQLLSPCKSWSELISQYAEVVLNGVRSADEQRVAVARVAMISAESPQDSAAAERVAESLEETARAPLMLHLVGYSFGCRIAFGVTELLRAEGHSACLILIDGPMGGPIGSFEQAILNTQPHSISGRLVQLLANGGEECSENDVAVDLYIASEAKVGLGHPARVAPEREGRARGRLPPGGCCVHRLLLRSPLAWRKWLACRMSSVHHFTVTLSLNLLTNHNLSPRFLLPPSLVINLLMRMRR